MELQLKNSVSDANVVDKVLTDVTTLNINLKRTDDIKNPKIILSITSDILNACNYAYIPFLKRYYFIDGKDTMTNNTVELTLRTDVLMTYKSDILASVGNLTRSTMIEYVDTSIDMDVRKEVDIYQSDVTLPDVTTQIMTALGDGN